MDKIEYLDFDLLIEKSGTGYRSRVLNSPAGQAKADFTLPFNPLEIENFILRVGRTRRGVRRINSPEMQAARIFGGKLFEAVFEDEIRSHFRSSLNEAQKSKMGLRIRLHLSEVPELANLPWEYLYDSTLDQFLALTIETPLVRYADIPREIPPLTVQTPLNILVMISSPTDYPSLDVEQEWAKLQDGLRDLTQRGAVRIERLEKATLMHLQRQLRRKEYHVFHYIGHGGFDEANQDGLLMLEDESGRGTAVSGSFLSTILQDEKNLRLAVLNACEGARTALNDPFAGVAQSLVIRGIPAVIAMQFEITDVASITLAHEFYSALADGYPVDAALTEARKAVLSMGNDVEWGTPVLYLRAPDGHIFNLVQAPSPAPGPSITAPGKPTDPERTQAAPPTSSPARRPVTTGLPKKVPSNLIRGGIIGGLVLVALLCLAVFVMQGGQFLNRGAGDISATQTSGVAGEVRATQMGNAPVAGQPGVTYAPGGTAQDENQAGSSSGFSPAALTATPTPPEAVNLTNNPEGGYYQVSLLFDPGRILHLVFYSRLPRGGDYYHQQMSPGGAWSATEKLTDGFDFLWSDLVQVQHPQGYICILWGGVSTTEGEAYFKRCQSSPGGAFSAAEIWQPHEFDTRAGFSPLILPDGSVVAAFARVGNDISFKDQILSDQISASHSPNLVQDTSGAYHLVWFRQGDPYSLEYSWSTDAGVSWSSPERLTTKENAPDARFDLVADRNGDLHLVWDGFDGGSYYRHWTHQDGWGEAVKITTLGCEVEAAVNAEGLLRVAEGCWDGVFFLEQTPDGGWLPPYQLSKEGGYLDIAIDSNDLSHIVWLAGSDIHNTTVHARWPGLAHP